MKGTKKQFLYQRKCMVFNKYMVFNIQYKRLHTV